MVIGALKNSKEIYISVDIEADGPIPGDYSMLSLGAAAFDDEGTLLDTFYMNMSPLPDASQSKDTMKWWDKNPEAWNALIVNRESPYDAMESFRNWCLDKGGKPVFVGYPASYDFMFVYWYLIHFVGDSPFGFQALDIKTLAFSYMGLSFKETTKKTMPKKWFYSVTKHSHIAVEDAVEQGELFFNIRTDLRRVKDIMLKGILRNDR